MSKIYVDGITMSEAAQSALKKYIDLGEDRDSALGIVKMADQQFEDEIRNNKDYLATLVGREVEYFGVDGYSFKIEYEGETIVLQAVEDPDDGYRSYHSCTVQEPFPGEMIFFKTSLGRVKVKEEDSDTFDGYVLVDVRDGHEWLKIGTDKSDDWYPCFIFTHYPKEV